MTEWINNKERIIINKVVIIGRLTKDCEFKFTPGAGTAVATFTVAVDRRTKEKETDFINCVAWQKTAELVAQYTKKGSMIGVSGRIQVRSYDAKDGTKRYVTEVVCDEVQFIDSKKETSQQAHTEHTEGINEVEDLGGDIPF